MAEEKKEPWLNWLALSTIVLAVCATMATFKGGGFSTKSVLTQTQASDQWAFYQAKGIKGAVAANAANTYVATGHKAPDSLLSLGARYEHEQADIQTEARKLEKERDTKIAEAAQLLEQHHHYAYAVALLQVAIALGADAALARQWKVLVLAALSGAGGIVVAIIAATRT